MFNYKVVLQFNDNDNTEFVYDKTNGLLECKYLVNATANLETPTYGIISNNGTIKLIDYDDTLNEFIKKNKHINGATVYIYLDNVLIQQCIFNGKLNYNYTNKQFTMTIIGNIEKLQNMNTFINIDVADDITAKTLLLQLLSLSRFQYYIDDETLNYLSTINIKYHYLNNDTIWNQLNKLANLCQLLIYEDKNMIKVIRYE